MDILSRSSMSTDDEQRLQQRINETLSQLQLFATEDQVLLDRRSMLDAIDQHQAADADASTSVFPSEADMLLPNEVLYEWIYSPGTNRPFAIQTKKKILSFSTISWIRQQAHETWNDKTKVDKASRFTYQRKGNYEVHLEDLLQTAGAEQYKTSIHRALTEHLYPVIRQAFGNSLVDDPSSLTFSVYDAIVIRYNATELAMQHLEQSIGAGQPLHRDLGLVSVNIMLNDEEEFHGGGTFFEHQLDNFLESPQCNEEEMSVPLPLKPKGGPGHALMHLSSDRHAGASTKTGVRDILVCFITACNINENRAPLLERAARLKSSARSKCQDCGNGVNSETGVFHSALCRSLYQQAAVEAVPHDGEAWHYLGMALWDIHTSLLAMPQEIVRRTPLCHKQLIEESIDCLKLASTMTPCDARLYNNLALLHERVSSSPGLMDLVAAQDQRQYHSQVLEYYDKAVRLHRASQIGGCDVGLEYDTAILNYGLYLANCDLFASATQVLGSMDFSANLTQNAMQKDRHSQVVQDAERLLRFCERQLQEGT